jgi:excisionase family DNA binding protein
MTAVTLKQETYLPEDGEQVAEVYDFLTAHEAAGRGRPPSRYFLSGAEPGDRTELPVELYQLLRQVVEALQHGLAVTVAPQTMTMTSQEAADLLGVSRPTLIKLLDEQKIPYERVGTHRKILLRDLLEYRERRREEQYAALEATAVSVEDEEDMDAVLDRLRAARRAVARRRRHSAET